MAARKKKGFAARAGSGVTDKVKSAPSAPIAKRGPRGDTMADRDNKNRMTKKGGNVTAVDNMQLKPRPKLQKAKPLPNTTRRRKG